MKNYLLKKFAYIVLFCIGIGIFVVHRCPLLGEGWSKQTIYVAVIDTWYGPSTDEQAHAMWIDDDSGEGIFNVKCVSDAIGIKPVFAVIPDKMSTIVVDSLRAWQKKGAGIILHGLKHESWKKWNKEQITNDILNSRQKLHQLGFDTCQLLKIIVPPHGCNTRPIREAIKQQKCQMVTGASLINPDRNVFQLGRIFITPNTDPIQTRYLLEKAYDRKAYVIIGTHSSIPENFSKERVLQTLTIAKSLGFIFDIQR